LAIELSHPRWLVEQWIGELGVEEARALLAADNEAAPTVLRVNRLRATRDSLLARLAHAGVEAEPTSFSPDGVRVRSSGDPSALPGYAEGLFALQGEASQLIAWLLGVEPHSQVLDACAAPGGKTTHIAEHLGERGMVVGSDRSRAGLEYLRATARRLGIGGIEVLNADARALPLAANLRFDAALVDAPCSGLGTLRQHPEIRWRRDPAQLPQLIDLQRQLIAGAAARVRPGGALVYATCTLLASENEQVVEDFVAANPDFELEHAAPLLPREARGLVDQHGYLRSWPHRDGLDGFFAARLKRRG
jgi:16S rRNA (cytosine967-C5)-methyltransferase